MWFGVRQGRAGGREGVCEGGVEESGGEVITVVEGDR